MSAGSPTAGTPASPAPAAAPAGGWQVALVTVAPTAGPGGEPVYHVAAKNPFADGPAEVVVGCPPPAGVTGVSASHPTKSARGGVVWELGVVPAGAAPVVLIRFAGATPGPLAFRVAARRPLLPELSVRLEVPPAVGLDDEFEARVVVANRGAAAAVGATVEIAIPDELLYRGSDTGGRLADAGDAAEWAVPAVAVGAEWAGVARFAGFAPGGVRLTATAKVPGCPPATADAGLVCEVRKSSAGLADLLAGLGVEADDFSAADRGDEGGVPHVVFRVGGNRFAVALSDVNEILRPAGATAVPGSPAWLTGVANVRGDIVPVVELAGLLGVGAGGNAGRALVVVRPTADDPGVGLLADDVVGIRPLTDAGDLPGDIADDSRGRFVAGLADDRGRLVQRLDLDRVLAAVDAGLAQLA